MRQTSIDCYHAIKESGLLSKRRLQAYHHMMKIAPCTASELQDSMDYNDGGRDCMKRVSELAARGAIYELGIRRCGVTGREVTVWDLTDNLPVEPQTKTPKQQRVDDTLAALQDVHADKDNSLKWVRLRDLIKTI